jgi:hypothetical protein
MHGFIMGSVHFDLTPSGNEAHDGGSEAGPPGAQTPDDP